MGDPNQRARETLKIYSVVLSVGVCCSLAIVSTYEVTRPIIQRSRIAQRQNAVLDILPEASTIACFRFNAETNQFDRTTPDAEGSDLVFAGFDSRGKLVGLAIEASGMGYQDVIRLLYAYSFARQAIVGTRILESRETPGLGDRIESDPEYLRNFDRLDVTLSSDGMQLAHPIEYVKPGRKISAWQIDGITGATISSRAVAVMLGASATQWVPRVHDRQSDFIAPEAKE